MTPAWQSLSIQTIDFALGWTLYLPRDLAVMTLGVLVGLLMFTIRWLTIRPTDLRTIQMDEIRLRDLIRSATAANDRERLNRFRLTLALVRWRKARVEFGATCISLVVLVGMMLWGQQRLEYLPLKAAETFQFRVQVPASAIGEVVHLVPRDSLSSPEGWIRKVERDVVAGTPSGQAEWLLSGKQTTVAEVITVRFENRSVQHPFIADTRHYLMPIRHHEGGMQSEVLLTSYRPFGWIPQHVLPGLPGWSFLMMLTTATIFYGLRIGKRS